MKENNWFILNGIVVKNPSVDVLSKYKPNQIIELRKGSDNDIVTEVWIVSLNPEYRINFSYSILFVKNFVNLARRLYFEEHNVSPAFDRAYYLPPRWFKKNAVKLPISMGGYWVRPRNMEGD